MALAPLERLLSIGHSDAMPERQARHLRVTNAIALLGAVLAATAIPFDILSGAAWLAMFDAVGVLSCIGCWLLAARGHRTAARALLLSTSNAVLLAGIINIGNTGEVRSLFFALALLPFLVFGLDEKGWLATFVALPVVAYFVTGQVDIPPLEHAIELNELYVPVLAFVTIITGAAVFGYINLAAETQLEQTRARAAQGARLAALGEMSSGIAHEIRNPLAAIHLAANQLVENPNDAALVGQLGARIQRIVMRASGIIEGLRSFARDASGDPFVKVPVQRIITDTLELCAKRISEHGVALTVSPIPPGLDIECRSVQLTQVLTNLLSNAHDAVSAEREPWVRVDVDGDAAHVTIAVTDSGPGIPAALRARLFEPFFTTKGPDRGTGLGLSLSRGFVEVHHGTLEYDEAAKHTRFVVRLPREQPLPRSA